MVCIFFSCQSVLLPLWKVPQTLLIFEECILILFSTMYFYRWISITVLQTPQSTGFKRETWSCLSSHTVLQENLSTLPTQNMGLHHSIFNMSSHWFQWQRTPILATQSYCCSTIPVLEEEVPYTVHFHPACVNLYFSTYLNRNVDKSIPFAQRKSSTSCQIKWG